MANTQWPPPRHRKNAATSALPPLSTLNKENTAPPRTDTPLHGHSIPPIPLTRSLPLPTTPIASTKKPTARYQNGFLTTPRTPSYTPYALNNRGYARQRPFAFGDSVQLQPLKPPSREQWNHIAHSKHLLPSTSVLRDHQIQCSDHILSRRNDIAVMAPTGSGKSLIFSLPLLARGFGVSLVIVPYTSLGCEAETNEHGEGVSSVFIYSEQNRPEDFERAAGDANIVVYVCPEMLESPSFARILYSESWKARLSGIYLDEGHLAKETNHWRPAYGRLHRLRSIIGDDVPLIVVSATLPTPHRQYLVEHGGLRADHIFINLGNYRPELSLVILPMRHVHSSFLDIAFILPLNARESDLQKTIIYCDDLDTITDMFWWFHDRLLSLGMSPGMVDVLHAGLSRKHQDIALPDFSSGATKFLLASEKVGAGMNFKGVCVVIQYKCRGLTIATWEQRRGRGARDADSSATSYLLVEESMLTTGATDNIGEDDGLLDLIQSDEECLTFICDRWMENPPRTDRGEKCGRCSRCCPYLIPDNEFRFISIDPAPSVHTSTRRIAKAGSDAILEKLEEWRLGEWKANWHDWPSYGPKSIVSDADLLQIAKRSGSINTVEDIKKLTHILHWQTIGTSLFTALQTILQALSLPLADPSIIPLPFNQPSYPTITFDINLLEDYSDTAAMLVSVETGKRDAEEAGLVNVHGKHVRVKRSKKASPYETIISF